MATPCSMWDLSSLTRDQTCAPPALGAWSLNHLTAREAPNLSIFEFYINGIILCICCCLVAQSCLTVTPWTTAGQASLSFTFSWSLLQLMSIESVMPSSHLILCHPFSSCLQSFATSRSFPSESALHSRWPKNISPSSEYSGLISFKIDILCICFVYFYLTLYAWDLSCLCVTRALSFFIFVSYSIHLCIILFVLSSVGGYLFVLSWLFPGWGFYE